MVKVYCEIVIRDDNDTITGYVIKLPNGKSYGIKKDDLKLRVSSGQLDVVNMTLTSDGRFIFSSKNKKSYNYNEGFYGIKIIDDELIIGDDVVSIELNNKLYGDDILSAAKILYSPNKKYLIELCDGSSKYVNCNISKVKDIRFGKNLVRIGECVFSRCTNLQSVVIPNSVVDISYQAYVDCKHLNEVYIPNSVVSLGFGVFHGCSRLTSVHLSENPKFTTLTARVFAGGLSLQKLVIPANIKHIDPTAFKGCPKLTLVDPTGGTLIAKL